MTFAAALCAAILITGIIVFATWVTITAFTPENPEE